MRLHSLLAQICTESTYLAGFDELRSFLCVHCTPVPQHVADTCCTVHKPHVILTPLRCGVETPIGQLQSFHPCQYCCSVDTREVIAKDQEACKGSVCHSNVASVIGDRGGKRITLKVNGEERERTLND